ncbi:TolC family protein [Beijerinckia indica]|uniref:Outer membrane efflux protein n=1 Tax=Beijerinckia indica subsp. indica (strain ATCC 9039 / DSM 1715 / NCIMB 8712) TaxID=395963 RepID=B2IDB1_BEII9|nr:TolC family protein [Beijerinckia indica]ACB93968.1 outer membrane efflux protein [Beijerinckia indica subsp. indica ATCC 9039]
MTAVQKPPSRSLLAPCLAVGLLLGGCATFSPDGGLSPAREAAASALQGEVTKITDDTQEEGARARVAALLRAPLTPRAAVEIALLRNKGLQAAFNDLGVSEAQFVQESLPPPPQFSISRLAGEGDVEVIRQLAVSLFALATLPSRTAIARENFTVAQWRAAEQVLALAASVRRQYYTAVAANAQVAFLQRSVASAEVAADLARKLGEAGNLNTLEQARAGAFFAEMGAQLADARIQAQAERERLTRLMGLWGRDIAFKLPETLPALPKGIASAKDIEAKALSERVDLKAGRHELAGLAAQYGLTNATRYVSDITLAYQNDSEWAGNVGGSVLGTEFNNKLIRNGFDVSFTIPIYDFGETNVRGARETYMASANRLAQRAIDVRSQAREAYLRYRGKYDLARYYAKNVLPLRKIIVDETALQLNGMIADITQLIVDGQMRITSNNAAITAQRDFFIASVDLAAATYGGGFGGGGPSSVATSSTAAAN